MVPLGLHLAARASHTLADPPPGRQPAADHVTRGAPRDRERPDRRRAPRGAAAGPHADGAPARPTSAPAGCCAPDSGRLLVLVALELAGCGALVLAGTGALALRRVRRRRTRRYGVYELQLSTHDEAKPQDLEDMVEAIANLVRAYPVERARDGQPHVSFELVCAPSTTSAADAPEVEWSLNVRCEPALVAGLDAAIHAAYPDVRLSDHERAALAHARSGSRRGCCACASSAASSTRCSRPTTRSPPRRWSRSRSPRSRSPHPRSCASSSPPRRRGLRRSRAGCTAATRTSSSAPNTGACARAA